MTDLTISPHQGERYAYVTSNGRLFTSLDAAEAYVTGWDAFWAVFAPIPRDQAGNWQVPFPMTREQYVEWAGRCGVTPWTDAEIRRNAYGCQYYQAQELNRETGLQTLRFQLANRRLAQLEWVDRSREGAQATAEVEPCVQCGTALPPRMLLTSPVGSVCPDCFDEAEEG